MINTLFVTVFGSGKIRPAPGTWGTLATLPFAYFWASIAPPITLIIWSGIFFFLGWSAVHLYQKRTGTHDASEIVIDETVGVLIPLSIIPADIMWYGVAFVAFRFFDILKPYPIGKIDSMHTAYSVMMDDVVAGIYALITVWAGLWLYTMI